MPLEHWFSALLESTVHVTPAILQLQLRAELHRPVNIGY